MIEKSMYDENGKFIPLTGSHGNIDGRLAHLRNIYMESEKEYFEALLKDDQIREEFSKLIEEDSETLFDMAMDIQIKLESGSLESKEELEKMKSMNPSERDLYHLKKLERAEGMMALLYAAAKDKVKIKRLFKGFESEPSVNSKSR